MEIFITLSYFEALRIGLGAPKEITGYVQLNPMRSAEVHARTPLSEAYGMFSMEWKTSGSFIEVRYGLMIGPEMCMHPT